MSVAVSVAVTRSFAAIWTAAKAVGQGEEVELTVGLEPTTACLQDRCATNCATPAGCSAQTTDQPEENRRPRVHEQ